MLFYKLIHTNNCIRMIYEMFMFDSTFLQDIFTFRNKKYSHLSWQLKVIEN